MGVDRGGPFGNHFGQQLATGTRKRETEGAVPEVEPQIAIGTGANQWQARGRRWPHTCPFNRSVVISGHRKCLAGQAFYDRQTLRLWCAVEAHHVDHRGDAQLLADSGINSPAIVIRHADLRRTVMFADGYTEAVALEG